MKSTRFFWLPALFILLLIIPRHTDAADIKKGLPAPDFQLTTLDSKTVSLSEHKGKKVILNFWASWCSPCKMEMPILEQFYKNNKDIVLLAVNLTKEDQSIKAVKKFADEQKITFPIPLDQEGKVSDLYQVITIPTTFFIDEKGILQHKVIGPLNTQLIEKLLKDM